MRKAALTMLCLGCVVAATGFWALGRHLRRPAEADIEGGVKRIVEKFPALEHQYQQALGDGVITVGEANQIISAAEKFRHSP